jgi:hypothetical protein
MNNTCYCPTSSQTGEEWTYGDILSLAANCILSIVTAGLAWRLSSVKTHNIHSVVATNRVERSGDKIIEIRNVEAKIVASTESLQASGVVNTKKSGSAASAAAGPEEDDDQLDSVIPKTPTPAVKRAAVSHAVKSAIEVVTHEKEESRKAALIELVEATHDPAHLGSKSIMTKAVKKIGHVRKFSAAAELLKQKPQSGQDKDLELGDKDSEEEYDLEHQAEAAKPQPSDSTPAKPHISKSDILIAGAKSDEEIESESPGDSKSEEQASIFLSSIAKSGKLAELLAVEDEVKPEDVAVMGSE